MKINRLLVNYLKGICPETYSKYTTHQNNTKVLYVEMEKALLVNTQNVKCTFLRRIIFYLILHIQLLVCRF